MKNSLSKSFAFIFLASIIISCGSTKSGLVAEYDGIYSDNLVYVSDDNVDRYMKEADIKPGDENEYNEENDPSTFGLMYDQIKDQDPAAFLITDIDSYSSDTSGEVQTNYDTEYYASEPWTYYSEEPELNVYVNNYGYGGYGWAYPAFGWGWSYPDYGWAPPLYGWVYPGFGFGVYPGYGWGYPGYGWGYPTYRPPYYGPSYRPPYYGGSYYYGRRSAYPNPYNGYNRYGEPPVRVTVNGRSKTYSNSRTGSWYASTSNKTNRKAQRKSDTSSRNRNATNSSTRTKSNSSSRYKSNSRSGNNSFNRSNSSNSRSSGSMRSSSFSRSSSSGARSSSGGRSSSGRASGGRRGGGPKPVAYTPSTSTKKKAVDSRKPRTTSRSAIYNGNFSRKSYATTNQPKSRFNNSSTSTNRTYNSARKASSSRSKSISRKSNSGRNYTGRSNRKN